MPTYLSNSELDTLMIDISNNVGGYNVQIGSFFTYFYIYGMRAGEAFDINRYERLDDDTYIFTPQKGNNNRTVNRGEMPAALLDAINNPPILSNIFEADRSNYLFKKFCAVGRIYILDKPETIHLYRHNRMKLKYDEGESIASIATFFGEVDTETVQEYIDAAPYYL